jgi:hypothetical protein
LASIAGVGLAHHADGGHCGIYYEVDDSKRLAMLHLADHNKLRSHEPSEYYEDFPSRFPPREQAAVSDLCRVIYEKHASEGLRYAVTRNDGFFADGSLKLDENGTGFSCATLVKAIYDVDGRPLIEDKTWPEADNKDREWLEKHLIRLRAEVEGDLDDLAHLDAVDVTCKWSRYRPEQIAYAMTIAPPAATYKQIRKPAELLMRRVVKERQLLGGAAA